MAFDEVAGITFKDNDGIQILGVGLTSELALIAFIALCLVAINRPSQSQMVVLGSMSIGGTINKVEELANVLQVCFDSGAKKY